MNSNIDYPFKINNIYLEYGNIASLNGLDRLGLLYFNFHNDGEKFYGIMRGEKVYSTEESCNKYIKNFLLYKTNYLIY